MADTQQDPELLGGSGTQSLCVENSAESGQIQVVTTELNEELVRQALVGSNDFDPSTIQSIYAVAGDEESEATTVVTPVTVCDTDQPHIEINNTLTSHHLDETEHSSLPLSSESGLVNVTNAGAAAIFTSNNNGTTLMSHEFAEGNMDVDSNTTYTVDVGSLQGNQQIISLPEGIDPNSVIISQEPTTNENGIISSDLQQIDSQFVQEASENGTIIQNDSGTQIIQSEDFNQPQAIRVHTPEGMTMTQEVLQSVIQQVQAQQLAQQQAVEAAKKDGSATSDIINQSNTVSFTLVSPSQTSASAPPLGSSQNPIRIIQQGNRYTPVQQLSTDQLQQIMQVVQQQHVTKTTQDTSSTGGTGTGACLFNPQTNTRIMYRVIYPSELHSAQTQNAGQLPYQVVQRPTATQEQQTGVGVPHQKRPYRKRKDVQGGAVNASMGEEDDKANLDTSELSKEEKEEKKKHRPRTRSGRVSKPPKHMVKDYKHIHVLDWDEDYDDSDGGYSDFKASDEEGKRIKEEEQSSGSLDIFSGESKLL